jgi:hypothetical protein
MKTLQIKQELMDAVGTNHFKLDRALKILREEGIVHSCVCKSWSVKAILAANEESFQEIRSVIHGMLEMELIDLKNYIAPVSNH